MSKRNKSKKKKQPSNKVEEIDLLKPYVSKYKEEYKKKYFYEDEDDENKNEYQEDLQDLRYRLHAISYQYYQDTLKQLLYEQSKPLLPLKLGPLLPKGTAPREPAQDYNGHNFYVPSFNAGDNFNKMTSPEYEQYIQSQMAPPIINAQGDSESLPSITQGSMTNQNTSQIVNNNNQRDQTVRLPQIIQGSTVTQQQNQSVDSGTQQSNFEYRVINGKRVKVKRTVVDGPLTQTFGADSYMDSKAKDKYNGPMRTALGAVIQPSANQQPIQQRMQQQQQYQQPQGRQQTYQQQQQQYVQPQLQNSQSSPANFSQQQIQYQQQQLQQQYSQPQGYQQDQESPYAGSQGRYNQREITLNDTDPQRVPRKGKDLLRKSRQNIRAHTKSRRNEDDYDDFDEEDEETQEQKSVRAFKSRKRIGQSDRDDQYDDDDGDDRLSKNQRRRKPKVIDEIVNEEDDDIDDFRQDKTRTKSRSNTKKNRNASRRDDDFDDDLDDLDIRSRKSNKSGDHGSKIMKRTKNGFRGNDNEQQGGFDEYEENISPARSMKRSGVVASRRDIIEDDRRSEQSEKMSQGSRTQQSRRTVLAKKKTIVASQRNLKSSKFIQEND